MTPLPCPFCGHTSTTHDEDATITCGETYIWIECMSCGARGPTCTIDRNDGAPEPQTSDDADALETKRHDRAIIAATAAWNERRRPPVPLQNPDTIAGRILAFLDAKKRPADAREIGRGVGVATDVARTTLSKLHAKGAIDRPKRGVYGRPEHLPQKETTHV